MTRFALSFLALVLALSAVPGGAEAADPAPAPSIPVVRPIFFAAGAKSGTVGGHVLRGEHQLYSLAAEAGQLLTVTITAPANNAVFRIYAPGTKIGRGADGQLEFTGRVLHASSEALDPARWSGRLPSDGTYVIAIGSSRGNAGYSMDVKIE